MFTDLLNEELVQQLGLIPFSATATRGGHIRLWGYCSDGSCEGDCVGGCWGTPAGHSDDDF